MKDRCLFKAKICNGEWVAGFLHCKNDNGISAIKQVRHLHLKCDQILSVSAQA